jgi:hypothetical protein
MTDSSDDHRPKKATSKRYYSSDSSSDDERRKKRHKKSKHKKKKSSSRRRDYDDSSPSSDDGRKKRKKRRKDESSDDDSQEESRKKRKKDKKSSKSKDEPPSYKPGVLPFGSFGILRATDYHKTQHQRSFEVWMGEIKGIPSFTGAKWELTQYFAEYMEDFNTCTFPHEKYFDYDKWELQEYERQKRQDQVLKTGSNTMLADEAEHRDEMRRKQQLVKQKDLDLLKQTMTSDKVQDMKHQQELLSQMRHAYKTGDEETRQRLARKLEPADER